MTSPIDPAPEHAATEHENLADGELVSPSPERRRVDQRRIDEVFGDVLPDTTSDERTPGQHGGFSEAHYRNQRPPHHVAQ